MKKKLISVVTPCFNEEANIEELYSRVKDVFAKLNKYDYEHIFIDNDSADSTVSILKEIAKTDKRVKILVNSRNFGVVRSSFYGLLQGSGDATILIFADLQEPPSLLIEFLKKWEEGNFVVQGVKKRSEEGFILFTIKKFYYYIINKISEVELIRDASCFSLYDKRVIEEFRKIDDIYPYLKGLVSELGFKTAIVEYHQAARKKGVSATKLYIAYDFAMLGITSHSKVPLRLATILGFFMSILSLILAFGFFIGKLFFWNLFPVGIASIIVGLFFFSSIQLFFIGIIGEYIGLMNMRMLKRPLVIEKDRINFK